MRLVVKQGSDARYRFGWYDGERCVMWHCNPQGYETAGEAAEAANALIAQVTRCGFEGVYTEDGYRWWF